MRALLWVITDVSFESLIMLYILDFFLKKGTKNTTAWFSEKHILQWDQKE